MLCRLCIGPSCPMQSFCTVCVHPSSQMSVLWYPDCNLLLTVRKGSWHKIFHAQVETTQNHSFHCRQLSVPPLMSSSLASYRTEKTKLKVRCVASSVRRPLRRHLQMISYHSHPEEFAHVDRQPTVLAGIAFLVDDVILSDIVRLRSPFYVQPPARVFCETHTCDGHCRWMWQER